MVPIGIELLDRSPGRGTTAGDNSRIALSAPTGPHAQLIPRAKGVAQLTAPLGQRGVLGQDAKIAVEHPILNHGAAEIRLFIGFAKKAVSHKALRCGFVLVCQVIVGARKVIDTDASTKLKSDASPVAHGAESRGKIHTFVEAGIRVAAILDTVPRVIAEETVESDLRAILANRAKISALPGVITKNGGAPTGNGRRPEMAERRRRICDDTPVRWTVDIGQRELRRS